mgnify:CR=1 FL=1
MNFSTDFADWDMMNFFVSMFLVGIGVALLATGAFTSYFGAGKSQKIGFALLFFGVDTLVVVYALTYAVTNAVGNMFDSELFMQALASGVAALAGMMAGMFVVLFVLMKVDTCLLYTSDAADE